MTIVDGLKQLIVVKGGNAAGVHTIADAMNVLVAIEAAEASQSTSESGSSDGK